MIQLVANEDHQLAFLQAIWPTEDGDDNFEQVLAAGNGYRSHGIAVPARSYTQNVIAPDSTAEEKLTPSPLHGMRVAIKDNYHISGTKTSIGNRAYYEAYSVRNDTADVVMRLLNAGVHVVGKVHLSSFAMMEHPMQSVDYQAPFNPRGDGYLITGGSSGASAAAVATYDWLDFSICSDTTGSARIPAFQVGVFGFRPSTNYISGKGLVKAWPAFDTPAWMGRDLGIFPHILRALHPPESKAELASASSVEILYPTDFIPKNSPSQEQAMDDFIKDMVKSTECAHRRISIKEDWAKASPVGEKDLEQYLYNAKIPGNPRPCSIVTEVVKWYWTLGSQVTLQEHEEMMNRLSVFKAWFVDYYMNESKTTIIALHIDKVQPRYRNQYPGNNNPNVPSIRPTFLAAILGALELAIPISQIPYHSVITGETEELPVVVSLLGPSGDDMNLLQWSLGVFRASGRPTTVKTGKTAL
ncbi:hypothetical protein PENSOL_c066G00578 [Penicillium solitum]|uniref:Amidase domain-containing protein n=1 Tax=Penicillium solitum TaxID=60172 RepID=A0A1V6QJ45_9EURO|nr:uncharacterized protein PENSOL_c066G00578 [Penicillium solitum]OQD89215.1 hypothetical protein PENSOL_c066G00578 [Penicillium solitum]